MKRVLIYLLRYRQTHYKFQINQSPSYHPQKLYSHTVSPAKLVLTILTKPLPCRVEVFGLGHIEQPNYCALGSNNVLY